MIHVFASGNGGGPAFSAGFRRLRQLRQRQPTTVRQLAYTIGVTGVDHDGLYINADGTFTSYPEARASRARGGADRLERRSERGRRFRTGQRHMDDRPDRRLRLQRRAACPAASIRPRFLADPDYTSRFNGTSAAAPMVSGVIALMLEANPNLTYRDVQEILLRSARQNAQFEIPASGGLAAPSLRRTPGKRIRSGRSATPIRGSSTPAKSRLQSVFNPLADPNIDGLPFRL